MKKFGDLLEQQESPEQDEELAEFLDIERNVNEEVSHTHVARFSQADLAAAELRVRLCGRASFWEEGKVVALRDEEEAEEDEREGGTGSANYSEGRSDSEPEFDVKEHEKRYSLRTHNRIFHEEMM